MNRPIQFNPHDFEGMLALMDEHNDGEILVGENERGDRVHIWICRDKITVDTYQPNDWVRTNHYYRDGTSDETYSK